MALVLTALFVGSVHRGMVSKFDLNLGQVAEMEGFIRGLAGTSEYPVNGVALVPQTTKVGVLFYRLTGDTRFFIFRPINRRDLQEEPRSGHFAIVGMYYTVHDPWTSEEEEILVLE